MKQKQLSILAASLVAAFAANVASAGNVASSNPQVARESITKNTQQVSAPEATYAFQGDLNLVSQDQTMQVQITLTGLGTWGTPTADSIRVYKADGVTAIPYVGSVTPTVSTDGKTLFATLTFAKDGLSVHKTPVVSFNRAGVAQSNLTNMYDVVGAVVECDKTTQYLPFTVKHFTGVAPGSTTKAINGINGAFEDESARNGANNNNVLMSFPTNIGVVVAQSTGPAKVDPAAGNTKFTTGNVAAPTNATLISTTLLNLGNVTLKQQANGYDSGLVNPYILADAVTAPAGVKGVAAAVGVAGAVEVSSFDVTVTAPLGVVAGGTMFLSSAANCGVAIAGSTATYNTGRTTATMAIPTAGINAAFGAAGTLPVYVCYDVSAASAAIPATTFATTAVLTKATGTLPFPEQNNACSGPMFPLSGGVKIDIRNYATPTTTGNWTSVLRLINPSEVNTATVYAQLIHADGTYGNWGQITTLKPRAVSNMTATEINALLTNVPTTVTPGAAQPTANPNSAGDRLRISAEGVGSLRVQNYLYNPDSKNFIEASTSQGVDFEGTIDRAPANEGQYQDQDAQTGLKK